VPGLSGLWLKAGPTGLDASVFLDLPEAGLYSVSVFGVSGGGLRFTADSCRKSVLCAEASATAGPQWRQVFSGEFSGGRHFLTVNLGRGASIQKIRVERKKDAIADYLAAVRRLGLDLGADGPVTRDKAVEAMRFIKTRRGLEAQGVCSDLVDREPTLVASAGLAQPVAPPGGGSGPVAGPVTAPINPISPPVIPPQDIASPTVPQ
jgi:hypothetical protein